MDSKRGEIRLSFNAPAILVFVGCCVAVRLINMLTGGTSDRLLFCVYRSSLRDPLTYVRCICHVFGHADWSHLINNMMYILILGPMIEEKYGTANTVIVMATTAAVTGIINMAFFPNVALMGASGIVFAFILMGSITTREDRTIPVTFILVALLYIGQQVYQGIFVRDNISQMAHITGGVVGSVMGFVLNRYGTKKKQGHF